MLGNPQAKTPALFDAGEVCRLTMKHGSFQEIEIAVNIAAAFRDLYADRLERDPRYFSAVCISAIFNAGRLQGIREERLRRKLHQKRES